MPIDEGGAIGWWSPDPRGVLEPSHIHVSRSLRRSTRRFEIRVDTCFDDVVDGCADPSRPLGWIDDRIRDAYVELHRLGWAHSIEVFDDLGLAGGLYGLAVGGLFAAESKFYHRRDASKVALVALCEIVGSDGLIDVQWCTPHLASLGATQVPRSTYVRRVRSLIDRPVPARFG